MGTGKKQHINSASAAHCSTPLRDSMQCQMPPMAKMTPVTTKLPRTVAPTQAKPRRWKWLERFDFDVPITSGNLVPSLKHLWKHGRKWRELTVAKIQICCSSRSKKLQPLRGASLPGGTWFPDGVGLVTHWGKEFDRQLFISTHKCSVYWTELTTNRFKSLGTDSALTRHRALLLNLSVSASRRISISRDFGFLASCRCSAGPAGCVGSNYPSTLIAGVFTLASENNQSLANWGLRRNHEKPCLLFYKNIAFASSAILTPPPHPLRHPEASIPSLSSRWRSLSWIFSIWTRSGTPKLGDTWVPAMLYWCPWRLDKVGIFCCNWSQCPNEALPVVVAFGWFRMGVWNHTAACAAK